MTIEDLILSIRERRIDALIDVNEGAAFQNSYGHGYDVGFLAALDAILEEYESWEHNYNETLAAVKQTMLLKDCY